MAQPDPAEFVAHQRPSASIPVLRKYDDIGIEIRNAAHNLRDGRGVATRSKIECQNPHRL
jgi:hypothetical protein